MSRNAQKWRDQSSDELKVALETLRKEIFQERSAHAEAKGQKTHVIGQKRKEIARILTILGEKERS